MSKEFRQSFLYFFCTMNAILALGISVMVATSLSVLHDSLTTTYNKTYSKYFLKINKMSSVEIL